MFLLSARIARNLSCDVGEHTKTPLVKILKKMELTLIILMLACFLINAFTEV
jgi:hypothetical protein